MKTAISIPDSVFEPAEELAHRLGTSRSQLYTQAMKLYLAKHRNDSLTQKLNTVYEVENSTLDAGLVSLQSASLPKEEW